MSSLRAGPSCSKKEENSVLLKFAERLAEVGQPEGLPKLEGKRMLMVLHQKDRKRKLRKQRNNNMVI
jgi:translation initiation factor IF-3